MEEGSEGSGCSMSIEAKRLLIVIDDRNHSELGNLLGRVTNSLSEADIVIISSYDHSQIDGDSASLADESIAKLGSRGDFNVVLNVTDGKVSDGVFETLFDRMPKFYLRYDFLLFLHTDKRFQFCIRTTYDYYLDVLLGRPDHHEDDLLMERIIRKMSEPPEVGILFPPVPPIMSGFFDRGMANGIWPYPSPSTLDNNVIHASTINLWKPYLVDIPYDSGIDIRSAAKNYDSNILFDSTLSFLAAVCNYNIPVTRIAGVLSGKSTSYRNYPLSEMFILRTAAFNSLFSAAGTILRKIKAKKHVIPAEKLPFFRELFARIVGAYSILNGVQSFSIDERGIAVKKFEPVEKHIGIPLSVQDSRIRDYWIRRDKKAHEFMAKTGDDGSPNQIAIFTALTGTDDILPIPEELSPDVDYICFNETGTGPDNGLPTPWQYRRIPFRCADIRRMARFVKLHPFLLLSNGGVRTTAVWMDANEKILRNDWLFSILHRLNECEERSNGEFACFLAPFHYMRIDTFTEAALCSEHGLDNQAIIKAQMANAVRNGLPVNMGLPETNLYACRITSRDERVLRSFFGNWWSILDGWSKRDQLSFMESMMMTENIRWFPMFQSEWSLPRANSNSARYMKHEGHITVEYPDIVESWTPAEISAYNEKNGIFSIPHAITENPSKKEIEKQVRHHFHTGIVITVFNAIEYAAPCIESVIASIDSSSRKNVFIVVINDASTDAAVSTRLTALSEKSSSIGINLQIIEHDKNVGYTASVNEGIRAAIKRDADFIISLNSDTIVPEDFWVRLVVPIARDGAAMKGINITSAISNSAGFQSVPIDLPWSASSSKDGIIATMDDVTAINDALIGQLADIPLDNYPMKQLAHGFCMAFSWKCFDDLGGFDEKRFPMGYGEEDDFCIRNANLGNMAVIAADVFVYHAKSKSFGNNRRKELAGRHSAVVLAECSTERIRRDHGSLLLNKVFQLASSTVADCEAYKRMFLCG
jgi:GT2 family glycosyltransferase